MKKIFILSLVLFSMISLTFSQNAYLGEIKLMSTDFAPKGWAKCEGQLLPINQNQALFSILGTTYGGNGSTNFALPDFRGRVAVGAGPTMYLGEKSGSETVTIISPNVPAHTHNEPIEVSTSPATQSTPTSTSTFASPVVIVNGTPRTALAYTNATPNVTLGTGTTTTNNGGSPSPSPISNVQPYLALTYMIAIQGIYPSQN